MRITTQIQLSTHPVSIHIYATDMQMKTSVFYLSYFISQQPISTTKVKPTKLPTNRQVRLEFYIHFPHAPPSV